MSLRKLCLFTLVAAIAAFAAVNTLSVQIREYEVPTPKSRPHDPALAPDGSLWYTGQGANKLGRLDPKTGEFKEYPLKTPNSGPHGLGRRQRRKHLVHRNFRRLRGQAESEDGRNHRVSRRERRRDRSPHARLRSRRHFVVHERRDELHRAPRSENRQDDADQSSYSACCALRHRDFAEQHANLLRVRRQQTGEHRSAHDDDSRIHFAGCAALARGGSHSPPMGQFIYTDYARGYLGHFDPSAGKLVKEWMSPGGAESNPYGIAITHDGEVWYSESGVNPNTLVQLRSQIGELQQRSRSHPAVVWFATWSQRRIGGCIWHAAE